MLNQLTEELKPAILDIICKHYHKLYVGPLRIKAIPGGGWDVQLGFQNDEKPIHIAAQLDGDDFLKYFELEIRTRHLADIHFYTGYLVDLLDHSTPVPIDETEHTKEDVVCELITADRKTVEAKDSKLITKINS